MDVHTNPIYREYFATDAATRDWNAFSRFTVEKPDFNNPDFSIETRDSSWIGGAKRVGILLLKIVLFPWGLYEAASALIDRIVMLMVCPAQRWPKWKVDELRFQMKTVIDSGRPLCQVREGEVVREVVLEKDGAQFAGLMIGTQETLQNGKWVLHATGNDTTYESFTLYGTMQPFLANGFNVLMVNDPGVGVNQQLGTVEGLGDAQEVGLTFLETALEAKKIILSGHSLGA